MKTGNVLLALGLFASLTSTGTASNKVWWEATALTPAASVVQQGITTPTNSATGVTQTLQLQCDAAIGGRCEWDVAMRVRNEEYLYGWAVDLATPDNTVSVKTFSYGELVVPKKMGFTYYPLGSVGFAAAAGSGPALLVDAFAFSTVGAPPYFNSFNDPVNDYAPGNGVAWELFYFRLSKDMEVFLPGVSQILGTTGSAEWDSAAASTFVADVAGNTGLDIGPNDTQYGTIITINNIPEPASIALLSVGALYLLCRRRHF